MVSVGQVEEAVAEGSGEAMLMGTRGVERVRGRRLVEEVSYCWRFFGLEEGGVLP